MVKYTYKAQVSKLLMLWHRREVTKFPPRVWYTEVSSGSRAQTGLRALPIILDVPILKTNWGASKIFQPCTHGSLKSDFFFYHWRGYYSTMTYLSIFNDINTLHKYVTIILHHQMLVIACLIKAVQFDLNKEFYHLTPSTWLILNNVIWKIFGSSF